MGLLQKLKQKIGLSYGEPIAFDVNSQNEFDNRFKDGFCLLSTPKQFIAWQTTYQELLDSDVGYTDNDVFYLNDPISIMGVVFRQVSIPLKFYQQHYRKNTPIRCYYAKIYNHEFDRLIQKITDLAKYSPNFKCLDKSNQEIYYQGIIIHKSHDHHDTYVIKNGRYPTNITDVRDYDDKLSLDKVIYPVHLFDISTIESYYCERYSPLDSDFCPYIKETPQQIQSLLTSKQTTNILWKDNQNNLIGICDKNQSAIIPIVDIESFHINTRVYEYGKNLTNTEFTLILNTTSNEYYQLFVDDDKSCVKEILDMLTQLLTT